MGPPVLDSNEECRRILRRMELETYGTVVSTLRAQGELNKDRRKLLQDLSTLLQISPERHKAEVRRAVNDEKLSYIANCLSGGAHTDWEWALEGRRIIPLLPRLLHPTPLTTLATAVSRVVSQNPGICLDQIQACERDESTLKYVRDPDDEDTLSPVMVPVASPDSSPNCCHSNNNIEIDVNDPIEKLPVFNSSTTFESKRKPDPVKLVTLANNGPSLTKRPRSPVSQQVVNVAPTMPKVRAVSPSCVRPQQQMRVISNPPTQLAPRGLLLTQARPGIQLQNPGVPGKIRVRAPVVQQTIPSQVPQRPAIVRPSVPATGVQLNPTPRPLINANIKQVVQIRAAPIQQQPPASHQVKESGNIRPVAQSAANVASSIAKSLPGKANVIVLHKNSQVARNIVAARDADRTAAGKASFLPKSVGTPVGTKMTFPSNVRIITVPSGGNVLGTGGIISSSTSNHSAAKVVTTTTASSNSVQHQKNVFVLELTNEELSKSIVLGDLVPTSVASSINGSVGVAVVGGQKVTQSSTSTVEANNGMEARTEILNFEDIIENGAKGSSAESEAFLRSCGFHLPAKEVVVGDVQNNGAHVVVQTIPHVQEPVHNTGNESIQMEQGAVHGVLDPQTGHFYPKNVDASGESPSCQIVDSSQMDIFSTALASAEISLDANTYTDGD